jgi:tripartite-type tricarboxylate transporter receptor subunit TctC
MLFRTVLALAGCVLTLQASAQAFPSKPIRLLVGYPPGGSGDFTTRVIGDELSKELGVAVVVENRPGAGGNIAAEVVSKAPADGYTLLNGNNHAINLTLYKNPGYRDEDFAPITKVAAGPTVIVVNKDSPFKNLRQLIDYAKANPGKLFNAGAGFGSAPHLAAALFESVAGVKFTSVQFKGGGPGAQSLIAGDTQVMFATSPTVTGFIQGGRMRAAELRIHLLVRAVRARRHAGGGGEAHPRRGGERALEARGTEAHRLAGHGRRALPVAGSVRRRHQGRSARSGEDHPGLRCES